MAEIKVLNHVVQVLKGLGLEPTVCDKTPEVPFEVALVSLGMDERNRPIVLQVIHAEQSFIQATPQEAQEEPLQDSGVHMLSFVVADPIEIPEEAFTEIHRLLDLVNKSLPLGHFNLSEIEKSVYYSYGYPVFSTPPCEMTILMIINTILFAKETFFPTIEAVANSQETVETLIQ